MRPRFISPLVLAAAFAADADMVAAQTCEQYEVSGSWATHQGNLYNPTFNFRQSGTSLSGTATLPGSEASRAGFTSNTGSFTGSLNGDRLVVTVSWPKGQGSVQGTYKADIEPSGASAARLSDGRAGTDAWTGAGPARCVRFAPKTEVTVAPTPSGFDTAVNVPAPPPGGAAVSSSPPLGDATKVTAVATGLTPSDITFIKEGRHACYLLFVTSLVQFEREYEELDDLTLVEYEKASQAIPEALTFLAVCLALVEAYEANQAKQASSGHNRALAAASRCRSLPVSATVTRKPRRKLNVDRIRRGALKVNCKRVPGGLAITYSTRSGAPLRKVVGSRLRLGIVRSRRDSPGGQLTFGYHKG